MKTLVSVVAVMAFGALTAANPASATGNWPASVVGTWSSEANVDTSITITISSQGTAGQCRAIRGKLVDPATSANDVIVGFYCPASGRIAFLRHIGTTNAVFQAWSGNLSQTHSPQLMGGTFFDVLNVRGEYEWFASQNNGG